MLTRKLITPGSSLAAALFLGLLSHEAAATEELIVYGADAAANARVEAAEFRSQMNDYVRSLNEQIEARLSEDLKELPEPKLLVASGDLPIRS